MREFTTQEPVASQISVEAADLIRPVDSRPMKFTLCITRRCNLACTYCYVGKEQASMPLSVAGAAVNFIFSYAAGEDHIDIGLFGGEPLLEFDLLKAVTALIEGHPGFSRQRVSLAVVTNGTLFSEEIADFLAEHNIGFCLSCDGPPKVQNAHRCFISGSATSSIVERTISEAMRRFRCVLVNAVYRPDTIESLPEVVRYFASLNLKRIYLNPDFTAPWTQDDARKLAGIYDKVASLYIDFHLQDNPRFVSLIDGKITVLLRGGYQPGERCSMGRREMAFTPEGSIYSCERLIGASGSDRHRIGHLATGLDFSGQKCCMSSGPPVNAECLDCGFKDYCINWCGCSNFFMTGLYNRVGPFLCASEKAAIQAAFRAFTLLEERLGPTFVEHVAGSCYIQT